MHTSNKILIINSGGTFNKIYNPISGELEIPQNNLVIKNMIKSFGKNIDFRIFGTVFKDSLDILESDREKIANIISESKDNSIILLHGTDTIDITAKFLADRFQDRKIILVGAMKPISIDSTDGILNFGIALGYLSSNPKNGIYISMSGLVLDYRKISKNRKVGIFFEI